jgi:hypothetical protein
MSEAEVSFEIDGEKNQLNNASTSSKKRSRKDRSQSFAKKKSMKEVVVKCSLPGTLKDQRIYPIIEKWMLSSSKAMYRGSLVFNRLLLYCLDNKKEIPNLDKDKNQSFYIHCFKVGSRNNRIDPLVKEVWDSFFASFPVDAPVNGDSQTYAYIAKNYAVSFMNSLQFCFEKRQQMYIKQWLKKNNLDEKAWHPIRCSVNNWTCQTPPLPEAQDFIQSQRAILNPPEEGINSLWIKNNSCSIVKYFWNILQFLDEIPDAKKFTLAPLHRIGRHFLTIDTEILYYLMKDAKLFDESISKENFRKDRDTYYRHIFKYQKLCRRGEFTYTIQTDGVSVCFHFRKEKVVQNRALDEKPVRNIAIDPGRTNLVFTVERLSNGNIQHFKLSRKEYYASSGMNARKRRSSKWQNDILEEEKCYSLISPKTSSVQLWDDFLKNVISVYSKLWEGKTGKKWAREKFRVYGLKRKLIDRFFKKMGDGESKPNIFYGAAKFSPNSKNELSAPTSFMSSSCARHFRLEYVDEYCTSKICARCDHVLSPVAISDMQGRVRQVRGLRRCNSNVCARASLVDRDLNAALNILRCGERVDRPQVLARGSIHPKPALWMMCRPESRRHENASIPSEVS